MTRQPFRQRWQDYTLAVSATALAALLRAAFPGPLTETPFLAFYPAVAIAAMRGFGPGMLATIASSLCYALWFTPHGDGFYISSSTEWLRLSIFLAGGAGVGLIGQRHRQAQAHEQEINQQLEQREFETRRQKELLAVTLASIGDGVIVTDDQGQVTFINGEAERLTGWKCADAAGQPLPRVFAIINEQTRQPVESPAEKVLRLGTVVGLANHTILLSRDGRETPIDDSGAPIMSPEGIIQGVVLVFRDFSEQKKHEQSLRDSEQQVRLKLQNILSPEGDLGSLELVDLIDVPEIQALMNRFYDLVRIPMGIIDLKGQLLVGVGWQDICTKFHRVHPQTCQHCQQSDLELTADIPQGQWKLYKCKNNMWDMATPIMVGDQHVGNLFTGQFFFDDEPVDREFFRTQARQYGFNEQQYLAALDAAPRLSRQTIENGMAFFMKLAHMISLLSYSNIKLARLLAENQRQKDLLTVQLAVLQSAANAIVITDPRGNIQWVNAAFSRLTGYSAAEAIGHNPRVLKSGQHDEAFYRSIWETVLAGNVWHGELVNRRKDGTLYTEEMTITPVGAAPGQISHFVAIKQDVTLRIRREKELHRLNRTLRALSNSGQAMIRATSEADYLQEACRIIVHDCGHVMVWIGFAQQDAAQTVLPVAQAGFDEGYLQSLRITWADTPRGQGPTGMAIRTGEPCGCPDMQSDPTFGPWRDEAIKRGYASSVALPLLAEGKAFGALTLYSTQTHAFSRDEIELLQELAADVAHGITAIRLREARAKSDQLLRQSLRRVELLVNTAEQLLRARQPQAVVQALCEQTMQQIDCHAFFNFLVDKESDRLHLNACSGIPPEEVRRIEWLDYGAAVCGCAARDGCRIVCENIPASTDPRIVLVRGYGIKAYACHPLLGPEGEVLGTLSFGTRTRETFSASDLALMKAVADQVATAMVRLRSEEALAAAKISAERAKNLAESASKAKDHFLAVLSHELRTPLAPVLATVSMLQRSLREETPGQFVDDMNQSLEMIHRNVEMEARLIDDLLDVTRIERGKVELHKQPLEVGTIIQHAVEVCRPDIEARNLHLAMDLKDGTCLVHADASRLQQVFWNLLKNAIKFTPEAGRLEVLCHQDGQDHVTVVVKDNGAGIDPEAMPRIFNAFEQAGRQITRQFGGLGLGLTISKAMVELHDGTIKVHSDGPGKGSTFTVRLPLLPRGSTVSSHVPAKHPPRANPKVSSLRILLVEDHADTARIMRRLLLAEGHQVDTASDVASGLKLARENRFDLLLSDLGLPDGSGLDLIQALRAAQINLPAIALSGYGQEQDIRLSLDAGFTAHLTKPVTLPNLVSAIARVVGKN